MGGWLRVSGFGGGVVPAPAATTTVVPAVTTAAVSAAAAAAGPFARAQLDAHALAAAVTPVEVANRVALHDSAGGGQVSGLGGGRRAEFMGCSRAVWDLFCVCRPTWVRVRRKGWWC